MANVSKLIFAAAIAVASISTPALAAHKTPIFAQRYGYVTRSSQGRGVYNFVPVPRSFDDSAGQPHDTPFSGGGF
jgi:hypothetical protein